MKLPQHFLRSNMKQTISIQTQRVLPLLFLSLNLLKHWIPYTLALSMKSQLPLLGKKALVTGASGGIGKAIAQTLAQNGAHVMVHYNTRKKGAISTCQHIQSEGSICDGMVQCDFRSPDAIRAMWKQVVEELWEGQIDILVNNAGIVTKLAEEEDDENMSAWHETMAVNLHAPLQLSRLAFKHMKNTDSKTDGGGCIIMNSSIHGSVSVEYMNAYAASKAALDSLTRGLSTEWAPFGVRVNAVAPGIVPVERTEAILKQPEAQQMWLPHLPVGRMGHVDDIADAVLYMCQADWMTGSILKVDGGMTARSNMPIRPRPAPPSKAETDGSCEEISSDAKLDIDVDQFELK